ncbi:hypothetical protein BN1356_00535 [Streptococcus varani]|uniref:C-deglycosylation enzyme beta subunit n=1 Tax=Streptococcus varani TaxID=1608583 RepID=A0A0E4CS64_9STRE|nr:DUF6379 domain-containing protein [Streptococcus varani]CQR24174.1 hypothetical protein BN1356_00535 [Streptococcus varani]
MLESQVIQYRGFHNIVENGQVVGFQVCVRSDYYRGVWLSQLRPGKVIVDGVTYPKEQVIWEINGKDYSVEELSRASKDFWRITDVATLKVYRKGGLAQGFHDVSVRFAASCSYMPPFLDVFDEDGDETSFNGGTYTRENMIIV